MDGRVAWILNLDAEEELAAPESYRISARLAAIVRAQAARAEDLLGPADVLLEPGRSLRSGEVWIGRAWCPTPSALRDLRVAGAVPEPAPSLAVLREVNERSFAAELGETLERAAFVESVADLRAHIAAPSPVRRWRMKRAFGAAGRHQRCIDTGSWSGRDEAWVTAALAHGRLRIEPEVELVCELAVHGLIAMGGGARIGRPCAQECDARGAWQRSRRLGPGELPSAVRARIVVEAERVAAALAGRGYFGPFGVDAYLWRDERFSVQLNPRSEVNARYTMGWGIGMGSAGS